MENYGKIPKIKCLHANPNGDEKFDPILYCFVLLSTIFIILHLETRQWSHRNPKHSSLTASLEDSSQNIVTEYQILFVMTIVEENRIYLCIFRPVFIYVWGEV